MGEVKLNVVKRKYNIFYKLNGKPNPGCAVFYGESETAALNKFYATLKRGTNVDIIRIAKESHYEDDNE